MHFSSKTVGIILGLGLLLTQTGCGAADPVQIAQAANPLAIFESDVAAIDDSLNFESELRGLFTEEYEVVPTSAYMYPMADYSTLRTKKIFGQYIAPDSGDRFSGYHTGDDVEVVDVAAVVPFFALTDATVLRKETVSGYGGVLILEFVDANSTVYHALYGHVDLSSITAVVGDKVTRGQRLGELGDDASAETDGERKHLHFAIYPSTGAILYAGYTSSDTDLGQWLNPSDWLRSAAAVEPTVELAT